jgi:hypothetical protein
MLRPYQGTDVKQGKGGYVRVMDRWLTLIAYDAEAKTELGEQYAVSCLGWGETFVGFLSDYSPEEQQLLLTTI